MHVSIIIYVTSKRQLTINYILLKNRGEITLTSQRGVYGNQKQLLLSILKICTILKNRVIQFLVVAFSSLVTSYKSTDAATAFP